MASVMRFFLACVTLLILTSAGAQQQPPDPALMQQVILRLQQQRNEANDRAALAEARIIQLTQEVEQLKAQAAKPKEDKPSHQ